MSESSRTASSFLLRILVSTFMQLNTPLIKVQRIRTARTADSLPLVVASGSRPVACSATQATTPTHSGRPQAWESQLLRALPRLCVPNASRRVPASRPAYAESRDRHLAPPLLPSPLGPPAPPAPPSPRPPLQRTRELRSSKGLAAAQGRPRRRNGGGAARAALWPRRGGRWWRDGDQAERGRMRTRMRR